MKEETLLLPGTASDPGSHPGREGVLVRLGQDSEQGPKKTCSGHPTTQSLEGLENRSTSKLRKLSALWHPLQVT